MYPLTLASMGSGRAWRSPGYLPSGRRPRRSRPRRPPGAATHPVEDGRAAQGPEQGGGLSIVHRRDRQLDIPPGLHQDTTQASQDHWAEPTRFCASWRGARPPARPGSGGGPRRRPLPRCRTRWSRSRYPGASQQLPHGEQSWAGRHCQPQRRARSPWGGRCGGHPVGPRSGLLGNEACRVHLGHLQGPSGPRRRPLMRCVRAMEGGRGRLL
jgi:hypothetical protein